MLALFDGVRLTPTQRRIAQCLLERGPRAAYLSSGEVAELARVSQPSVTRFAMALGYDGYPALRRAIQNIDGTEPDRVDEDNELQHAVRGEAEILTRLADRLGDGGADRLAVAEAGKLLAGTRPLPILGLRSAAPLAAYFGYFAAKVHPDVRVLDHGGSLLADRLEQARAAGATAMLGVVLPRYPKESLDALRDARTAGLWVVVITDSPVGPAAHAADVALTAPVGSRLVFDLHGGPMAVAMVLLQAMCDAAPGQTLARLEEFEVSAARRGVFVA
ncbi:MAG: transcriptional regulator [Actinobacteria bacterium 13_2_20CM_2_71_6]|nr:MAG: transcriptional regulator [Actinobacteria bacterium 13_2_20CM_2_71_6]